MGLRSNLAGDKPQPTIGHFREGAVKDLHMQKPWREIVTHGIFVLLLVVASISSAHAAKRTTYVKSVKIYSLPVGEGYTPSLDAAMARNDAAGRAAVLPPYVITEISDWEATPFQPDHGDLQYIQKGPMQYIRKYTAVSTENPGHVLKGGFGFSVWLACPSDARTVGARDSGSFGGGWSHDWNCAIDEEASTPQVCYGPKGGNPIDVFSGRKEERISLLSAPISVDLFYNSKDGWRPSFSDVLFDRTANRPLMVQNDCITASFDDGIGGKLKYCFPRLRISEWVDVVEPPPMDILYQQPDGSFAEFTQQGRAVTAGVVMNLEVLPSLTPKYIIWKQGELRAFDQEGRLTRVQRPDGGGYDLTYLQADGTRSDSTAPPCLRATSGTGLPGQPTCLTDRATGRQVHLAYGSEGLTRVVGAAGEVYEITYNGPSSIVRGVRRDLNLVTKIDFPDGRKQLFGYNEDGRTSGADLPHALTSKSDFAGLPFATFSYTADGRAAISEHPNGIGRTEVRPPDSSTDAYTVIGPDNVARSVTQRTVSYLIAPGLVGVTPLPEMNQQPAGAGCAAAWAMTRYSQTGLVTERTDLNGSKTCVSMDEQTMKESSRIEGLTFIDWCPGIQTIPEGGRKISTEWHPRWHLATRTAEPRRITTYVYNGQPDPFNGNAIASCAPSDAKLIGGEPIAVLCKRVEQSTTDTNGAAGFFAPIQPDVAARIRRWTYNSSGQVITEIDARGKAVLTNAYYSTSSADHATGDLESSVNAANHLSRVVRYNAFGKAIETIDPNGVVSTFVYDNGQRLTSATVAGKTSSYAYWPNGLLKTVTQPDLSTTDYIYDVGQRLTAVVDSAGNRIEYTVDGSGRRVNEEAKDPQGMLKRTMSRMFDALGRTQQSTGRE